MTRCDIPGAPPPPGDSLVAAGEVVGEDVDKRRLL